MDTYQINEAVTDLIDACYGDATRAGWHTNPKTGVPFTQEERDEKFPQYIALMHSELSEALEGHRKGLMDDHLPHRPMVEVELADALIRLCDTAGAMGYDLAGAVAEKLAYNRQRADYKMASRVAAGGKRY